MHQTFLNCFHPFSQLIIDYFPFNINLHASLHERGDWFTYDKIMPVILRIKHIGL